ncbi:MAG: DUF2779 domain-containing protein [Spirochaetaceae bacterium]|nr:MAG: DUF2779 domain-containing protein [Spirochaetaceae bacterium]
MYSTLLQSVDGEALSEHFARMARRQALTLLVPVLPDPVVGTPEDCQDFSADISETPDGSWLRVRVGSSLREPPASDGDPLEADIIEREAGVTTLGMVSLERGAPLYATAARAVVALEERGLAVHRVLLIRAQKGFVHPGLLDPDELFERVDITDPVRAVPLPDGSEVVADTLSHSGASHPRSTESGGQAAVDDPRTLFLGKKRGEELISAGVTSLRDLPEGVTLSRRQTLQVAAIEGGVAHVDQPALDAFLSALQYPVRYLDFEAFSMPVPPFAGARSWEHIPYLYTVQSVLDPGAPAERSWYLGETLEAIGDEFCTRLLEHLGEEGSIVVYGRDFEARAIARLAERLPARAVPLRNLLGRIVDLSSVFSEFAYYHPLQRGSVSMKSVLPVLTGRGYDDLVIRNGRQANLLFGLSVFSGTPLSEQHRHHLVEYCLRDTEGMVWMVEALSRLNHPPGEPIGSA